MWERLKLFLNPFDARYEEMTRDTWRWVVWRDVSAGLIVAMMAIPMAMGFAIAAGLRPEHGIVAGAIAGVVGGLFGGSKYNTYGPVAALIPVVAGLMATYATPEDPYAGHGFMVLICMGSGLIMMLVGLLGWGKFGNLVPHSIVVGFSVGIAVVIGLTQLGEVLGLKATVRGSFLSMLQIIGENLSQFSWVALFLAGLTFLITRYLLKLSIYIPAPLIAIGVTTVLSATVFSNSAGFKLTDTSLEAMRAEKVPEEVVSNLIALKNKEFRTQKLFVSELATVLTKDELRIFQNAAVNHSNLGLTLINTKYGAIPTDFLMVSEPTLPSWDLTTLCLLGFYSLAFAFVCGFEGVLCARMADRMADNNGTPYNPDKEFWGQGLVQLLVPLLHGMPLSGALARTATKVQVGGMTPLAEILKSILKLLLVYFLASYLEMIPMACIGGILLWVSFNMVKPVEIKKIWNGNWFHAFLMIYTSITVIVFGFLGGVVSAMVIWGVLHQFLDKPTAELSQADEFSPTTEGADEDAVLKTK